MNQQIFEQKVIRHNQLLDLLNQGDLLPHQTSELWYLEAELNASTDPNANEKSDKLFKWIVCIFLGLAVFIVLSLFIYRSYK